MKQKIDYSRCTDLEFDEHLKDIINETPGSILLKIPGVYEALSEHYNNDILTRWEQKELSTDSVGESEKIKNPTYVVVYSEEGFPQETFVTVNKEHADKLTAKWLDDHEFKSYEEYHESSSEECDHDVHFFEIETEEQKMERNNPNFPEE
jgi:hypothetical protein